jgi:hypothetical protein
VAGLWAADRPAQRQKNQQARIKEGVESGELTKGEARRIQQRERQLHREVKRDRADGPGLTPAERAKIEAQQDALSAKIAKEKHDAQKAKK